MDRPDDYGDNAVYIVPQQGAWGVELVYNRTLYSATSTPDRSFAYRLAHEAIDAFGKIAPDEGLAVVEADHMAAC